MKRIIALGMMLTLLLAGCQLFAPAPPAPPSPTPETIGETPTTQKPTATRSRPTSTSQPSPAASGEASPTMPALAGLPDPATARWVPFAEGFQQPTAIVAAPGFPGRIFVLERKGVAWTLYEGERHVFLDLQDRVGSRESEQGLLGMAFHPRFPQTPWVFVNYTDHNGDTVVSYFPVDIEAWTADAARETVVLQVDQPYGNHNGGHLLFGPDEMLYIGLGDGGAAGDPHDYAQNPDVLLGKMLRIDVRQGAPYTVPPDNPFVQGGGRPEIWALGLRNPWRYDFDPWTGDLYIADVGQNAWEEVNFWPADGGPGANFGWDYYEGTHPYEDTPPPGLTLIFPVAEYGHDLGCSVTGGVVYRGRALPPEWQGVYLYGDFCSGRIWGLRRQPDGTWMTRVLFETGFNISTFGRDQAGFGKEVGGEVYLAHYTTGAIYRLEPAR